MALTVSNPAFFFATKHIIISSFTPARVGTADAQHYRVLLQAAGGGGSSSAALCTLHRRNVSQGTDGGR